MLLAAVAALVALPMEQQEPAALTPASSASDVRPRTAGSSAGERAEKVREQRARSAWDSSKDGEILASPSFKPPLADVVRYVCDHRVRRACTSQRDQGSCTRQTDCEWNPEMPCRPDVFGVQQLPSSMFNCPAPELPEATRSANSTTTGQQSGGCAQLKGTSLALLEPSASWEQCDVSTLSHCSVFGYVTIFDGLGHYFNKLRSLMLAEHEAGVYRAYKSYFEEFIGLSAIHLRMPNLPHDASLYCHEKQIASDDAFSDNQDLWDRQYECNLVPPLDDWFNLRSELLDHEVRDRGRPG